MENIVAILDLDGFHINKKFYCKEAGISEVGQDVANSFFFDIGIQWSGLHEKDKRSCRYVIKNIQTPLRCTEGYQSLPTCCFRCYRERFLLSSKNKWRINDSIQWWTYWKGSVEKNRDSVRESGELRLSQSRTFVWRSCMVGDMRKSYGTKCIPTLCQGRGRSLWTLVGKSEGLNHPKKKNRKKQ